LPPFLVFFVLSRVDASVPLLLILVLSLALGLVLPVPSTLETSLEPIVSLFPLSPFSSESPRGSNDPASAFLIVLIDLLIFALTD